MKHNEFRQKMNKKIIDIFEHRGWGLYEHSQSLTEMIYTGYESICLEAGIHYVPLPLTSDPTNPEIVLTNIKNRVNDYDKDNTLLNRLPYFVDLETTDNEEIKVNGVYLIDSVVYEIKQISLIIDSRFREHSNIYPHDVYNMKNPNIIIDEKAMGTLEKQIMKATR